jgi:hypothetical protein
MPAKNRLNFQSSQAKNRSRYCMGEFWEGSTSSVHPAPFF